MSSLILITGASAGIGEAIARRLADQNHTLVLTGWHHEKTLRTLCEELTQNGTPAIPFVGDLKDPAAIRALFSLIDSLHSPLFAVVNNAGISHVELFQDSSDENLSEILDANLKTAIRISKEAVQRMLSQKDGRILNISSVWGLYGASMEVEYSTTKGALNAFTKALGKELAPSGIAVNALALGAIDTPMNGHLSLEERASLEEEIPMGRMGTPEEAAAMAALLLEAPKYLTGAVIPFDGGWI